MKLKLLVFSFLSSFLFSNAQVTLAPDAEISVLTIGPGTMLNDAFGHSAFRVKDKAFNRDLVFDYGRFDFDTPSFYLEFAQGKLNYKIGLSYYKDFYANYVAQQRSIKEQVLNLNQEERQALFDFLTNNIKPENKYYLYDFFYDNCATKIKDVVNVVTNNNVTYHTPENFQQETFRALIQNELNYNSWGSVGIDIALGSIIDKKATPEDHMFLPKNIHSFFSSATFKNDSSKLIKEEKLIFDAPKKDNKSTFITSPLFVFLILSLGILFITYKDKKTNTKSTYLDIFIFTITGLIGIGLLLLWFATNHTATGFNYNLLWAFALNIFVIKQVLSKTPKQWFIKYLKLLVIMLCLMTLHWTIGVQVFAPALIPLLVALMVRYLYLISYYNK
ncbi:DUF4105 domain-containing protein [Pontimicrobium sp. IMCC45349]|uniref:lipoprotein N-acyltransferase Lnb domain-containing protein n=1 Tax=Pontimicrobium sp. IMCC45349 TaxID=3391574 RepID=UPI0039A2D5EC